MKEVIVHIGAHKTGTSSIQESMAGYDDGRTIYARFDPPNHSIPITTIFSRAPYDYHIWKSQNVAPEQVDIFRANFRALLDAHLADPARETLIISGEDIGILADEEKLALCDYITSSRLDLKIVCFVRDPRGFTASAIQQHIRNGMAALSRLNPGYRLRLGCLADTLPPNSLLVRDFAQAAATHGDIVRAFADLCGIDASALPIARHNESLSLQATKLILRLNRLPVRTSGTRSRVRARAKFVSMLAELYPVTGASSRIDEGMTEALAIVDPADLAFLEDRFGIAYPQVGGSVDLAACDAYFSDLGDVDLDVLRSGLADRGVSTHPADTIDDLLLDAFYVCQHQDRLEDADAPYLRDIAMKIADGESPSMLDAVALMTLAARARPGGPMIKQKLEEWQRLVEASQAAPATPLTHGQEH